MSSNTLFAILAIFRKEVGDRVYVDAGRLGTTKAAADAVPATKAVAASEILYLIVFNIYNYMKYNI